MLYCIYAEDKPGVERIIAAELPYFITTTGDMRIKENDAVDVVIIDIVMHMKTPTLRGMIRPTYWYCKRYVCRRFTIVNLIPIDQGKSLRLE